jgi:NADH:quinone reductase (non-electrogenic)
VTVAASELDMTHIVNPVRKLLNHVHFFNGEVQQIDLDRKRVTVTHGKQGHAHELEYDYLVIALGSTTNFSDWPA